MGATKSIKFVHWRGAYHRDTSPKSSISKLGTWWLLDLTLRVKWPPEASSSQGSCPLYPPPLGYLRLQELLLLLEAFKFPGPFFLLQMRLSSYFKLQNQWALDSKFTDLIWPGASHIQLILTATRSCRKPIDPGGQGMLSAKPSLLLQGLCKLISCQHCTCLGGTVSLGLPSSHWCVSEHNTPIMLFLK